MGKRGARNLIPIYRLYNTSDISRGLVPDLEPQVVKVATPACNVVSDLSALRPKVAGSWSLPLKFPDDLDSFILLSFIATALHGHTDRPETRFQDALARNRVLNGLAATGLDLDMIFNVGYVVEVETDFVAHLRKMGAAGAREAELHAIPNKLCARQPRRHHPSCSKARSTLACSSPRPAPWRERSIATG